MISGFGTDILAVEQLIDKGRPRAPNASENHFLSLAVRRNQEATTRDFV